METSNTAIKEKKDFRILLVYPNIPLMLVPSLGVAILTRILKEAGYNLELFDGTAYGEVDDGSSPENRVKYLQARKFDYKEDLNTETRDDLLTKFREKVEDFEPDIMMFTAVEDSFLRSISMLSAVADKKIPNIIGGVFPTSAPERCFEFDDVDAIALGEGDQLVLDIAERARQGESLIGLPGVWTRKPDGSLHRSAPAALVDINKYRADFSLYAEERFYRPMGGKIHKVLPLETYRGCPYACTFCNSPNQRRLAKGWEVGPFSRRKTMENLKEEMEELIEKHQPGLFYFTDDSFLARPAKEIIAFCEMYKEIGIPFWFNTRPENCTKENLKALMDVGCFRISFGIECGDEAYREETLQRKVKNDDLVEKFRIINESGVTFSLNLIAGFPGETRELIMETVHLVRRIGGYDSLTVSIFTPYHGTVLRDVAVEKGWLDPKIITVHTMSRSLLRMPPPYLSADEITGLVRVMPLYCYFPESEWDQIRLAETDDEEGNKVLEHYSEIYRREFFRETLG